MIPWDSLGTHTQNPPPQERRKKKKKKCL